MKPSFYNIYFEYREKRYVYNTLTTSLMIVDGETSFLLEHSKVDSISDDKIQQLQKQGIIVDDNLDETKVYECYYNDVQYGGIKNELRIVFVPTYNCNLKCTYCFEVCRNRNTIKQHGINQIVDFVEKQLSMGRQYNKISLVLFGGEPLLCSDSCILLCQLVSNLSRKLGIEMKTMIITNATLISPEIIKKLFIPYNMKIQITMDGSKVFHDQRRIYRNGDGTYDKILESIKLLNKHGVKDTIDLRINVDKNNISTLEGVLSDIYDKVGYIYVGLLRPAGNNRERISDCISDNDYLLTYRPQLEPLFTKYGKRLHYGAFGKKHPCALNSSNSYIIDCGLDVYKCDNLIGLPKYSVGKIENGIMQRNPEYYHQRTWSPFHFNKCKNCKRLPACTASCAYICLEKNGSMNKPFCYITEEQLVGKIKQYIDNV